MTAKRLRRQWRAYKTASGACPVKEFLDTLSDDDAAEVAAGMREVRDEGLKAARHLRGDIYEVRVDGETRSFRVLFSCEGRYSHVLLSLSMYEKKTRKAPKREIELAAKRLRDWRTRCKS